MTLDEAIKHCEEVAFEQIEHAKSLKDSNKDKVIDVEENNCIQCANEHQRLAGWLKDYKRLLERESSNICIAIPKNATNEDAIRAVFPDSPISTEIINERKLIRIDLDNRFYQYFPLSWWNDKYRKEG